MNEKISFPDLVSLLASKMNVTKKEAEAFLKEFFTISTEVISSGEELKIDGLGLFRPIWVEARGSVNVQTGEPVEIPGHYKLSFIPDKILREAVNAPFSSFSVEILNDHVSTEQMIAVESEALEQGSEVIPDESDMSVEESEGEQECDAESMSFSGQDSSTPEHGSEEPMPREDASSESSQPEIEPVVEPVAKKTVSEPEPNPVETAPDDPVEDENEIYGQKSISRRAFWWGVLTSLGVVVLACAIGYAIWAGKGSDSANVLKIGEYTLSLSRQSTDKPMVNKATDPIVLEVQKDTTAIMPATEIKTDTAVVEQASDVSTPQPRQAEPEPTVGPVVETIRSGVFLTTLARKHFGHKAFWVYIYEENKGVIENPNQVPIGTRLTIPAAAKYGIDATDKVSVDKAKELAARIQSRYE